MVSAFSEDVLRDIEKLKAIGFEAGRLDLLPSIFKAVYKKSLRKCGSCQREAFEVLTSIYLNNKKNSSFGSQNFQTMGELSHRFKRDKEGVQLAVKHQGGKMVITSKNLTQDKVNILLNIEKYAHNLEVNPKFTGKVNDKQSAKNSIDEAKKRVALNKIAELAINPNVQPVASVSTSTGQPDAGKKSSRSKKKQ